MATPEISAQNLMPRPNPWPFRWLSALSAAALSACAGPGKALPARIAYTLCPETMSLGAFVPDNDPVRRDRVLLSCSFTFRLKPGPPPVLYPSLLP